MRTAEEIQKEIENYIVKFSDETEDWERIYGYEDTKPNLEDEEMYKSLQVELEYAKELKEKDCTISALESELKEVLDTLVKASPNHLGWVKMNYPDYKEK